MGNGRFQLHMSDLNHLPDFDEGSGYGFVKTEAKIFSSFVKDLLIHSPDGET